MAETRTDGFYWIRWRGRWMVAQWSNDLGCWSVREHRYSDASVQEIGPSVAVPVGGAWQLN